jgi:flagellar protein FliS
MNAQQSYREAGVLGASPVELTIRLYEKMIDDLRQVSDAIEKKEVRRRTDRIKHAILIVGHLESSLDFDRGGKVARNLELLYQTLRCRLLHLQFHPSTQGAAQLVTDLLAVRQAWVEVQRSETPAAAPSQRENGAAAAVYGAANADQAHLDWRG